MTTSRQPSWDAGLAWRQVAARDGGARFLYGVTSTGIFCRPSCPSRRPAQRNVVYFRHAGQALAAGYRACLRCQPAGPPAEAATVAAVCAFLKANFDRKVTLAELAKVAAVSPFTVQRLVRRVLGVSPAEYQRELRAAALRDALAGGNGRVTDAIYDAGYSSSSRAYEGASAHLGMSPSRYRARGEGETIRFTVAECPLGKLLVAATGKGVCAVALGDDEQQLEAELGRRFPAASLVRSHGDLETALRHVLSQLTQHPASLDLAMDVRATAFQTRVWQALSRIPRGETRSYSQIAREIGDSRAARAVARACASNPVALLVPCHRVVGAGGKLTGYRWGLDRKRKLLDLERG